MGLFGENKQERVLRYIKQAASMMKENDKVYINNVNQIYDDYFLSKDQFDPKIKISDKFVSNIGLAKFRLYAAMICQYHFMKKDDDMLFLNALTGMCLLKDVDNSKSENLMAPETFKTFFHSNYVSYIKNLSTKNLYALSEDFMDILNDSFENDFLLSEINRNAIRIRSMSVCEAMSKALGANFK